MHDAKEMPYCNQMYITSYVDLKELIPVSMCVCEGPIAYLSPAILRKWNSMSEQINQCTLWNTKSSGMRITDWGLNCQVTLLTGGAHTH